MVIPNFSTAFKEQFLDAGGFKQVALVQTGLLLGSTYAKQLPLFKSFDYYEAKKQCEKIAKACEYQIVFSRINAVKTKYTLSVLNKDAGLNYRIYIASTDGEFTSVVLSFVRFNLKG